MKSIKTISAAVACLGLLAAASASAQTVWKPPAEIQKAAGDAAPGAAPDTPITATPAAPETMADKEKSCKEQAVAKGLKGKAKKHAIADCVKG